MVGFRLYLARRAKRDGDAQALASLVVAVGAVFGALLGAKLVFWFQEPYRVALLLPNPRALIGGKTIVGGLIGGRIGVEIAKKIIGMTESTGDSFVTPVAVGLIIGRLGCFFSGLHDGTHGIPTMLPWGVDYGDGLDRHPTQLYEIVWVAVLWRLIRGCEARFHRAGDQFRALLAGYLFFRLGVEWLKPEAPLHLGLLTGIQWVCLVTLLIDAPHLWRVTRGLFRA
ncbi:prolipoprotein diacylglyceryl transferase [Acanthopleuribacter pedis]|uniref:Prolipoprotein diacylglyceryl transferase n=1 Tax=Acanthopleuribacter pedis TaxID=442870 RepID=A0A8J7U7E5_9BACT|nr:prolipoprotein diacylglyceryl transferase family protein [Acanthopleuribacter pedis]MBO1321321.1 prolipoprotein diacylglyceryl transferase [Acanthopleuribacter pedis]